MFSADIFIFFVTEVICVFEMIKRGIFAHWALIQISANTQIPVSFQSSFKEIANLPNMSPAHIAILLSCLEEVQLCFLLA